MTFNCKQLDTWKDMVLLVCLGIKNQNLRKVFLYKKNAEGVS